MSTTKQIKIQDIVKYGGHSQGANGSVNLKLEASYGELVHTIEASQLLNNDVLVKFKLPQAKAEKLGTFRIKQLVIHDDGESSIKLNGLSDYVEMDKLNLLPLKSDVSPEFKVLFESEVEIEGGEEEDDE